MKSKKNIFLYIAIGLVVILLSTCFADTNPEDPTNAMESPTINSNQTPTEVVTSTSTVQPTENATPIPTENATPLTTPTEKPTPTPTEKPTPTPTEKPTPKPTEKPTPKPTEKPTPKPTEKPSTSGGLVWIPTIKGNRYHTKSTCSGMEGPIQVTKSEAESRGFTPCGRCYK